MFKLFRPFYRQQVYKLLEFNLLKFILQQRLDLNFSLLILSLLIFTASCNTTEPPPPDGKKPTLTLALEDVSCTEAWLQLTTKDLALPAELTLKQYNPTGDSVTQTFSLSAKDSLLYIDSLLPNQNYKFKIVLNTTNNPQPTTNEVIAQTMDTTSHNFTWQTFEFGQQGNSLLRDVAIIDENNIWVVVGELYMNDSLGNPDATCYNAVHWDGTKWELKRIYTYSSCSAVDYAPLRSVYAFSPNKIVVTSGGGIWWFDGNSWKAECSIRPLLTGAINKLWGSSSADLYAVGNNGNIAHWDGLSWKKIESGTSVNLLDVWGTTNGSTIWACGYSNDYSTTVLLKGNTIGFNKLYEGTPNNQNNNLYIGPFSGGWTNSEVFSYLLSWGHIYSQDNKDKLDLRMITQSFYDVGFSIDGNDKNDIMVSGQDGMMGHYNGVTFKEYDELKINLVNYYGVAIKGNLVVAVGYKYEGGIYSPALITIGQR